MPWTFLAGIAGVGEDSSGGSSGGGRGKGVDTGYLAERQEHYRKIAEHDREVMLMSIGTPEEKEYIQKKWSYEHKRHIEKCEDDKRDRMYMQMFCSGTHSMSVKSFCEREGITLEEYNKHKEGYKR